VKFIGALEKDCRRRGDQFVVVKSDREIGERARRYIGLPAGKKKKRAKSHGWPRHDSRVSLEGLAETVEDRRCMKEKN